MPETEANVHTALLEVQRNAPSLQRNAINPHFNNRFISLDSLMGQILPVLNENDLVLMQMPCFTPDGPGLTTRIAHVPSRTSVEECMPLMLERENPQGQGSAITYARRYALMSMLGLVADQDDDANAATPRRQQQGRPASTRQAQQSQAQSAPSPAAANGSSPW